MLYLVTFIWEIKLANAVFIVFIRPDVIILNTKPIMTFSLYFELSWICEYNSQISQEIGSHTSCVFEIWSCNYDSGKSLPHATQ